jgi:hypothetical protein
MAFTMPEKFTAEQAQEWMASNHESLVNADPKDFLIAIYGLTDALPTKPRVSKKVSPSPEERASKPYDDTKCDARVFVGPSKAGLAAQCSCKKIAGQFLCKRHQKTADQHDGKLENGFITGERPTHHYGDTDLGLITWHDVELPEKKKAVKNTTSGSQRKCSVCGECGHNKSKCPQKSEGGDDEIAALKAQLAKAEAKEAKKKSDAEKSAVASVLESVVTQVEHLELDEDEHDLSKEEQTAAGTGIELEPEPEPEPEQEDNEDNEDDEDNEDNSTHDCTFEEIPYTRDNENKVFDDDFEEVGEWNGKEIVFDSSGLKMHKKAMKYHKAENVVMPAEDM